MKDLLVYLDDAPVAALREVEMTKNNPGLITELTVKDIPEIVIMEEQMFKDRKVHELKINTKYAIAVARKKKNFEIRKNDRDFKEGDFLVMREYENGKYLDLKIIAEVTYVLNDFEGLKEGYVALGIKVLNNI